METLKLQFMNHEVRVIRPDHPNGKWIWKTEFFYAFDQGEQALAERGYTRVYFAVSDRYGSYAALRLMHQFHRFAVETFGLEEKCILFGFSRGGLYAFNYALTYPECVEKIYLDAPVLDMRSWPPAGSRERAEVYEEYDLTEETLARFKGHPIENMEEFFALNIPLLLVAGGADEVVPFAENAGKMISFCEERHIPITAIVKPDCKHHPHSLEDVTPILEFVEGR